MARSKKTSRHKRPRYLYLIPVLLAIVALTAYYALDSPAQAKAVLNYTVNISIQLTVKNGTSAPVIRFVVPPIIGTPGGVWRVHTYDAYGVSSNYPIYTLKPPSSYPDYSVIHVQSTSNRTYTLGDFFAVWGEPLAMNDTLGYLGPPPSSQNSTFGPGWFWDMCVGASQSSLRPGHWGSETLVPNLNIVLIYSNVGCL